MVGWEAPQLATINTPRTLPSDQERVLRLSESLSKNSDPIPYTINEQYPLESHPVDEKSLLLLSRECELNNYDPSDSNDNIKPRNYNSLKSLSARDRFEEMADESVVNNGVNSVPPSKSRKPPPVTSSAPTPPATSPTHNTNNSSNLTPNAAMPSNKERPNGGGGSALKRGLTSIFKRTNSNAHDALAVSSQQSRLPQGRGGSDPVLNKSNQTESNTSASATTASGSVTPPSAEQSVQNLSISESSGTAGENSTRPANNNHLEPATHQFFGRDRNRATSGLGIRQKLSSITFNVPPKDDAEAAKKKRDRASSSMDLISATAAVTAAASEPEIKSELKFQPWGLPPDAGTGLKARRISVSLPDDFAADSVDLYTEFSDQSKLIGRRGKTLGKGATSKVTIMVRKSKPDQLVAVKEFRGKAQSETPEEYAKKVWSEFSIARSLHHPNIIETIRLCKDSKGRWNHVMEYCEPGDLFHLVEEGYLKGKDRESDRLCMFKQLMQGINYLHSHGIAHRDIKLENLLLTSDSKLKITDFGVSEVFSGIHPGLRSANGECGKDMGEVRLCKPGICGSLPYIAPEVVAKKNSYDPRGLDIWSAGIVMLHLHFGGALWTSIEDTGNQYYNSLVNGWEKWIAKDPSNPHRAIGDMDYPHVEFMDKGVTPPSLRRMLLAMLRIDPTARITVDRILKKGWVKGIECCQIDSFDSHKGCAPPKVEIDAAKKGGCEGITRVVRHDHLPTKTHKGHGLW